MCEGIIYKDSYIDLTKLSMSKAQVLEGGGGMGGRQVKAEVNLLTLISCQPVTTKRCEYYLLGHDEPYYNHIL